MSRHGDKHSVVIAGHATSITLEPEFWAQLKRIAQARGLSLAALIAEIDQTRSVADSQTRSVTEPQIRSDTERAHIESDADAPYATDDASDDNRDEAQAVIRNNPSEGAPSPRNLSAALRVYVLRHVLDNSQANRDL